MMSDTPHYSAFYQRIAKGTNEASSSDTSSDSEAEDASCSSMITSTSDLKKNYRPNNNTVQIKMNKVPKERVSVDLSTDKWYSLHQLARNGDADLMESILTKLPYHICHQKMNQLDKDHLAPLHYAARYSHTNVVKLLLDLGADVNIVGEDGLMPLHCAARYRMSSKRESIGDTTDSENSPSDECSVISLLTSAEACVNCRDDYGLTPLHYAAMRGNEEAMKTLLKTPGINTEVYDKQDMTPLHLAATYGYLVIASLLINAGANVLAEDEKECTPLHRAASEGSLDIVELLLHTVEQQLDALDITLEDFITKRDKEDNMALHHAVVRGHLSIAKLLIIKGRSGVNAPRRNMMYPLHLAAISGNAHILKLLIDEGADVNCLNGSSSTPLHIASGLNDVVSIELLLNSGADIEARDSNHYTPLLIAASKGHLDAIRVLLKFRAKSSVSDKNDKTAVYLAAQENNPDVLEMLLKTKKFLALINRGDRYGDGPLHVACRNGFTKVVQVLLKFGASVGDKNEDGRTALHFAAENGWTEIVKIILKCNKFIINNGDEDSNSPLHLASSSGHANVVRLLLRYGADLTAKNCHLWTPLDCAASAGHVAAVAILLKSGACIDPMDKSKATPLHLASKAGHTDVVVLLLKWGANVTQRAYKGENCLDLAIQNRQRDAALAILKSDVWQDSLRNMHEGSVPGAYDTPLRKLIVHMPDVAEYVFDKCIKTNGKTETDSDLQITYNFEFLDDMFSHFNGNNESKSRPNYNIYTPDGYVRSKIKPLTYDREILKKHHPLMIMVQAKRQSLLAHPLCVSLVNQKWSIYGRYVYFFNLFLFLVFLCLLTGYVLLQTPPLPSMPSSENVTSVASKEGTSASKTMYLSAAKNAIIAFCLIHLCKEIFQLYQNKMNYFTPENILEWVCYVCALLLVLDLTQDSCNTGTRLVWQWEMGAVAIFLAWMVLLLFIRKFPFIGIYIVMFTVIMKTFGRFFFVFLLFIIAFALGFYMLLQNQDPFQSPWESIVKTTVMMIGEMEYDDIFNNPENSLHYKAPTFLLFVVFLVIMSIIIMNLLVGLAVDDIKGVQDQAQLERLAMRVEMVLSVESLLPMWLRRKCIRRKKVVHPNKWKKRGRFAKLFRFLDETSLTSMSTYETGLQDSMNKKLAALEENLQQLRKQHRQLQKMMAILIRNNGAISCEEEAKAMQAEVI